jgi:hypothetical protein
MAHGAGVTTRAWQGGEIGITGDAEVEARLLRLATAFPDVCARALMAEAEIELNDAVTHTPIGGGTDDRDRHVGQLRGTARVIQSVEGSPGIAPAGRELMVTLAEGGAGVLYAIRQHQVLHLKHPHGGESDYLLGVLERAANGGSMLSNIAARVEGELAGLGGA